VKTFVSKKQSPHPVGIWDEGQACVRHAYISDD
jgi:hypothetical protein